MNSLGLKILFVEDNEEIREALLSLLEEEGYEVTAVGSAEEGLAQMKANRFDLLVTDYSLPGETGTWLVREAEKQNLFKGARAMLVTAHPNPKGAEGLRVIRKPLDLDDFLREIHELLAPARAAQLERTRATGVLPVAGVGLAAGPSRMELVLYISSASHSSLKALRTLQALLKEYDVAQVQLTVRDLFRDSSGVEEDRVAFTPTLVKRHPGPRTWIVGDLRDPSLVTDLLSHAGIEKKR
ncbi:MAG TPA: response regulator [Myxococcaceae bacterium]|nr:response regulator [Myxococcaceae bacterium]